MKCRERIWFLRFSHTRLADLILDLCSVPTKDSLRRTCYRMLTQFSAPPPNTVKRSAAKPETRRPNGHHEAKRALAKELQVWLDKVVENDDLPRDAANRLRLFLSSECLPLSANVSEAILSIGKSLNGLRAMDEQNSIEPRRLKRYEDAARSLLSLKHLVQTMDSIGIGPSFESNERDDIPHVTRPRYISLDLGFRQKRKHFHGQLVFQCIALPNDFFEAGGTSTADRERIDKHYLSTAAMGTKIAEGGRYDELVSCRDVDRVLRCLVFVH